MIVSKHRHPPALVLGTLLLAGSMTRPSKSDKTDLFSAHLLPLPSCTAASHSLQLLQAHQKHCLIQTEFLQMTLYTSNLSPHRIFPSEQKQKCEPFIKEMPIFYAENLRNCNSVFLSSPFWFIYLFIFSTGHVLKPVVVLRHISILKIQSLPGLGAEY